MALELVSKLRSLWPFSAFKFDDLSSSNELVRRLKIPERTKQFVYAVQDPETQSVIYILSAQSLSESSASDVTCLIRAVEPDAVIAHVAVSHWIETLAEEDELEAIGENPLPTSSAGVVRRCFVDKVGREKYEGLAGSLVLREIFGVGFHGHLLAAKSAADETGSSFLVVESPTPKSSLDDSPPSDSVSKFRTFVSGLIPSQAFGPVVASRSRRFLLTNDVHSLPLKSLSSPFLEASLVRESRSEGEIRPDECYEAPKFARSLYPLLADLRDVFADLPSIGTALANAQKMLRDVDEGRPVDARIVSEVRAFRVAVEGLRTALNEAGRSPVPSRSANTVAGFSELSVQEKSRVLFAQALRARARKFKTAVAVVDAGSLAGLRRHWNDPVPPEIEHLVGGGLSSETETGDPMEEKRRLLGAKPVVAVGAGATAVVGVTSLSKTVPASTLAKAALAQTHKALSFVLGKTLVGHTKAVKAAAAAEKLRAVAHGVIASAERTSLSAMRTAFYEIMRKRRGFRPVGALPWATFGCSVATCSGLIVYGDGIECAVESIPAARSIAILGRGVRRLQEVSRELRRGPM